MAGDKAVLRHQDGSDVGVLVSPTEEWFDRVTKLCVAGDTEGLSQMLLAGRVWSIPPGTRCLVIDPGIMIYEVRIQSGPYSGRSGFVATEFVSKDQ